MTSTVTGQISGSASPAASTGQIEGASANLGFKAPCRAATIANVTLSGLQTIDGVVLAANDRVLVWHQTSSINNGIYLAQTTAWTRAVDFDGARDATFGTLVYVAGGTAGAHLYRVTTAAGFTIGVNAVDFAVAFPNITVSTGAPSGGLSGDVWLKVS